MRKRILTVLLSVLFTFSFVACSCATSNVPANNNGNDDVVIDDPTLIIDSVDDPQPIEITEPDPEPVVTVVEPDPEPVEVEPEPDPNEELTMEYLDVDESWLKDYEGLGLKRDGELYSLCDAVPAEKWEETKVGLKNGDYGAHNATGDYSGEYIIVEDKFVITCVTKDDDLAWYGNPIGSLKLVPMSYYGNTVTILQNTDKCDTLTVFKEGVTDVKDRFLIYPYKNMHVQLIDSDGNDVFNDFRNLNCDEQYTLKWNDGSDHEEQLTASWKYYKPTGAEAIVLNGTPTDDPLVEKYDFSSVPSGVYYMVESYAFIQVE